MSATALMKSALAAVISVAAATPVAATTYDFNAVALTGMTAPGVGGATFTALDLAPFINAPGDVAFTAGISDGSGVFKTTGGALAPVVRNGDPVPGFDGETFLAIGVSALNSNGETAILSQNSSPDASSDTAIHVERPEGLTLRALGGVSGGGPGFSIFSAAELSNFGSIAYYGRFLGDEGIFSDRRTGTVQFVYRAGFDMAPDGRPFATFDDPAQNVRSDLAFKAGFAQPDGGENGVYKETDGLLGLVALEGDAAPGGGAFASFRRDVDLNDLGDVAFAATVGGETGLFKESGGALGLVTKTGETAPGAGSPFDSFGAFSLNASGDLAFAGVYGGLSGRGLFVESGGAIELVVGPGDQIDVGGDLKTISTIFFGSGGFSDFGELAFAAEFTDRSQGVFTAMRSTDEVFPAPLPAAGPLLLAALAGLALFRRRTV